MSNLKMLNLKSIKMKNITFKAILLLSNRFFEKLNRKSTHSC